MSDQLLDTIDALVDPFAGEHGDWDDVLHRVALNIGGSPDLGPPVESGSHWWRRRRPLTLALIAIALLVLLFATPAFGLRDAVLDLIGRNDVEFEKSEPASSVVKRQFGDLGLGAPPSLAPQAIPGKTREVTTLRFGGKPHTLYVAPTRRGGFCYLFTGAFGGCQRNGRGGDRDAQALSLTTYMGGPPTRALSLSRIGGVVLASRATTVAVEFEDGHSVDLPFVWVSTPIRAGFFVYDVPADRQQRVNGPTKVIARDERGATIATEPIVWPSKIVTPPIRPQPVAPRILPTTPLVAPTAPLQRGSAGGVTVTAGRNGSVVFDTTEITQGRREILNGSVSYVCFRLRNEGGVLDARGVGFPGKVAARVGRRYFGVGTPFDGCEIQGSYGHRWPDRLGSHSGIEIPFTDRGRRYFEDRAAARDLAGFVRSRAARRIRREHGNVLATSLRTLFGTAITRLPTEAVRPPEGRIGYWISPAGVVFSRVSATGRVYRVEIEKGRIARQNVEPFALVF